MTQAYDRAAIWKAVRDAKATLDGSLAQHNAVTDPHTGYQKESEKGIASGYASLDGAVTVPDAQIPAGITRDSEHGGFSPAGHHVAFVQADHDALPNPHHVAFIQADHDALPNPHHSNSNDPITGEKQGLAGTDGVPSATNKYVTNSDTRNSNARTPTSHSHAEADVTNLVTDLAAKEATANKGVVSGYASLDSTTKVPVAQLGTGTPDGTRFLKDDMTWTVPAGGGSIPTPICITLWQDASLASWANMPAAETEFRNALNTRTKVDLTNSTQSRITVRQAIVAYAGSQLKVKYSTDDATWYDLCVVSLSTIANQTLAGTWTNVPAGAKADVFVRVVGIGGNGTADPSFGLITLQVK